MGNFSDPNPATSARANVDYSIIELEPARSSSPSRMAERSNSAEPFGSVDGPDPEENLPLGQAIKQYPKIVGYCLGLTVVVIGWGYDLVVVGSINGVDPFQKDYGEVYDGELIIPAMWLSLWLAATPLGMAFGSLFGGWFQDRVGRRMSLLSGSTISAIGAVIIFFSYLPELEQKRVMFFIGKVIQGFSIGILKVTAMTYISETAPVALRGSAMALVPTGNLTGQLIGSIVLFLVNDVEGKAGYLGVFGSQFVFALAPFLLSIFMPESPAYLEEKGETHKAVHSANRLFAPRADPLRALQRIRASIEEEKAVVADASFKACFSSTHQQRTWIVIMANLFPAMFGLDLLGKSSYFLQTIGMASGTSLMILIGGIVAGIVANGIGIWVMSRVGRRTSSIVSLAVSALLWTGMGISGFWDGQVVAFSTAGILVVVIVVCGMGCWPAGYAVMGETSSLRLRAKTQAIGGVVQQLSSVLMSFVLPYVFNPDAGNLGAKTGFVYTGLCAIAIALCWFQLPELRGRSVMEIDEMFNLKLPVRQFKSWRNDEA